MTFKNLIQKLFRSFLKKAEIKMAIHQIRPA